MNTATTPEVCAGKQTAEQKHRESVQAAMRRAHDLAQREPRLERRDEEDATCVPTDTIHDEARMLAKAQQAYDVCYSRLDALIDQATPLAQAMALTCLVLSTVNNAAGAYVQDRLEEAVINFEERESGLPTGEPEDVAYQWLALLAGLRHGYQDAL